MTPPPDLSRKVRQLDNDVQAIYEMLAKIEATQARQIVRLDELATVQAEHGEKLDEHGAKLDEHGAKLDQHGAKLDQHSEKLDQIIGLLQAR